MPERDYGKKETNIKDFFKQYFSFGKKKGLEMVFTEVSALIFYVSLKLIKWWFNWIEWFSGQIPNTAIMMATYEVIIYCFKKIQPPQTMSMASHI